MKIVWLMMGCLSASAWADDCLNYHEPVQISGLLVRETFAEQPNYESIAQGDAKASYFFIRPRRPLCLKDAGNMSDTAEQRVRVLQLVLPDGKASFKALRPALGHRVTCIGQLFHAETGHHHSRVLMSVLQCKH